MRHRRIDFICYPAGQLQAARSDGLGGQQCMIEATEAQTDHEDNIKLQLFRKVGSIKTVRQRYAKTAYALHYQRLGLARELRIGV